MADYTALVNGLRRRHYPIVDRPGVRRCACGNFDCDGPGAADAIEALVKENQDLRDDDADCTDSEHRAYCRHWKRLRDRVELAEQALTAETAKLGEMHSRAERAEALIRNLLDPGSEVSLLDARTWLAELDAKGAK